MQAGQVSGDFYDFIAFGLRLMLFRFRYMLYNIHQRMRHQFKRFYRKTDKRLHHPPGITQGVLQRYCFFFRALADFFLS